MKKLFTLLFAAISISAANAQLPDGSIAPDFTLTDINGNTWHLYELLDQGKSVVLDISATWCGPCWAYHESGALENLYETYGPNGTGEFMVFMIEGDPTTNLDCIYNLPDCNSSTQGDWTAGTPYPIINDDNLADLYNIGYYPTIYHICPNRILTESPQETTDAIYAKHATCPTPSGVNNAGILKYQGFSGFFCGSQTFAPSVKVQNLGTAAMTSATAEFRINGALQQTLNWTGDLGTFGIADIAFDEITLIADADMEFRITAVNGASDDDATNNTITESAEVALLTSQNVLTLELLTDKYPGETYWEVKNSNGDVLYAGGNGVVTGNSNVSDGYQVNTLYTVQMPVPGDGCYEFAIYDAYGDGICCVEGPGYFKLKDPNGNIILEGGSFLKEDRRPFGIDNAATPISNNGAIVGYAGDSGDFCGTLNYKPVLALFNLGTSPITSAVVEISSGGTVLGTTNWTGNIQPAKTADVILNAISIDASADLQIAIKSVNGSTDDYTYKNTYQVSLKKNYTEDNYINMSLQLDSYAYEIYWQLTNSAGDVLYSGGNELVGPNGGGLRIATPTDPGVYANNDLVEATFALPAANDCYTFLLVDDYGDGLVDGGGGYLQLTDSDDFDIIFTDYTSTRFTAVTNRVDVNAEASGVQNLTSVNKVRLFPNPATEEMNLSFHLSETMPLQVSVFNLLGEQVLTISEKDFATGANLLTLDVSRLDNAVYFLKISSGEQQLTRKFTVIR